MPQKTHKKSPRRKRKAYKHPIPSRNDLLNFLEKIGKPLKIKDILSGHDLKGQRVRALLEERLTTMVRAGQIIENRRGEFCLTAKLDLITGTVIGHRDGFGFVRPDHGGDDVYLSAREMRSVFDGDRVAVKIIGTDRRGKPEGDLVEVLERGLREVAGQFIRERGIGLVIPDNAKLAHRILIAKGEAGKAKPGQIVVAEILDYPTQVEQATGRVVRVIGDPHQKGIATDIAIQSHAIPVEWPKAVRDEIKKFGASVPGPAKSGRVDLRDTDLVTIDGADARDFDDAVYCEPSANGWRLLVAIADVAHYVEIGSALDKQATTRGTSVYFPDRVVPMLPEVLSNGLCSLNPNVDRLCMVCDMRVSADGKVTKSTFVEAVMKSSARLTYSQVSDFLTGKSNSDIPKALHTALRNLHDLYKAFAKARQRRGAIELDIPGTRFELGRGGEIAAIKVVERNDAHRLIEECMIAANVQAAKFLRRHRVPGLYRVHAKPDPERFEELRQYLLSLGFKVPHPEHVEPRQFNQLLNQAKGRADSASISMAMLRSLTHAEYTPVNIGHFGLALDAYAHFTSPIRRYPDLLVHRAIRHIVRGGKPGRYHYDAGAMERLGAITSAYERRAEDATRDVEAWLKCEYMEGRLGEEFDGVITGVTNFGLFVQISELLIDGLVHVTSLSNDYYHYESATQQLVGERSGKKYRLGEAMRVQVQRVDMESRRIDFRPAVTK
ncbi:MAG: ribonuclease R [Gammaproteobacteria bacterium]|nr:ribonuclease R [Gammaproteobacteria bacterium]MDH3408513.1 ribonuclease R [Gammaproteobacteria bacterium]